MKKVLFVATVVKTHINTFHLPYLKRFQQAGWETSVAARYDFEKIGEQIKYCDRFYPLPFSRNPFSLSNIKAYKMLKKIIDENNYDIIHCNTPVGGAVGRLAAMKARRNGTKVIYTAHGFHFYSGAPLLNWMIYYPTEKALAKVTDVLVTINGEDFARGKKMGAKDTVYVEGVGIDTDKFDIGDDEKRNIRAKIRKTLNIPFDAVLICSVGELNKNKNHSVVIEAVKSFDNVYYIIAGEGPMRGKLTEQIDSCGLKNRVQLLGYRRDVSDLLSASDVFCFPSKREGLPLSVMEAMACGLPAAVSKIRGNSDLIIENKGGFLVSPDSADEFKTALGKLVYNKELRESMGKFNREYVKKFDIKNVMRSMENIYGLYKDDSKEVKVGAEN